MIKKNRFMLILTSVCILLPCIMGAVMWSKLPNVIATHFGGNNLPNGWNSKGFTVFGLPLIILAIHWIAVVATAFDKKKANINQTMLTLLFWICPIISLLCSSITYLFALGYDLDIGFIVMLFIGALFILLGNYLPKCKQNSVIGVRTFWTMKDTDNWYKTQRLAGWCLSICGVIIMALSFLNSFIVISVVILAAIVTPIIYSFLRYRKRNK